MQRKKRTGNIIFFLILTFCLNVNSYSLATSDSLENIVQDTIRLDLFSKSGLDTNSFNVFPKNYSHKKVGLVLSGGGARGLAQMGVINVLEKNGIRIDMVVGTSIGALIGGLYSSGYKMDELEGILKKLNWEKALSLTNKYQRTSLYPDQRKVQDRSLLVLPLDGIKPILLPSSFSNGLYLSEKINSYILNSRYHPKNDFSDLKIPFSAVATNLDNGKRVILSKGNLSESIKASLTFPLLYTPIKIDGQNLVDGGLSANIPNDIAKDLGADLTIVVNSTSNLRSNEELDDPLNTADQILSIAMSRLNNLQLKESDIIITPDIKNYSSLDYTKLNYLIEKGEEEAMKNIALIKNKIDSLDESASSYKNNFITNPEVKVNSQNHNVKYTDRTFDTLKLLTDKNFEKYTSIEKNLKMLYRTGKYKNVYAVISRKGMEAEINYILEEYPVISLLIVENQPSVLDSMISGFRKSNVNKPVDQRECYEFYDDLLGKLRNYSYSLTDVEKFYFDYSNNTLEIVFSSGKFKKIDLTGNKVTNENVIMRELVLNNEIPLRKTNTDESIKNVISTNLFQQVSFNFDYSKNKYLPDLDINLVEKNSKALRFSLKIDNERRLQLLFDLRDENIFGTGIEAGLLAAGGTLNQVFQFDVQSDQFFSLPFTFNFNLYYKLRDIYRYIQIVDSTLNEYNVFQVGEYSNIKYGLSFLLGTQFKRYGTIYGQIFYENQQIDNISNSQNLTEDLRVIKLKFGGTFDTEDKVPFPTKGTYINVYYETAKNTLPGVLSYTKFFMNYDFYFPTFKSQTFRPRFIFGYGDKTTPLTEQFTLGGQNSFFGMVDDEFKGRQILELSFEYRYLFPYKLFFDTYLSVRYDLGNIWVNTEDIRFKDLRHGIGLTAAFDTPIGEASFSSGKSFIIKKGLSEDSFIFGPTVFYFSIGYDI
ncbi:MAG TPA: patatin-like phospholipase family protein [Ignavibacteria bacterium]|nr:patatin-like phospholipase family protein [Ignavibacteria bacterium]